MTLVLLLAVSLGAAAVYLVIQGLSAGTHRRQVAVATVRRWAPVGMRRARRRKAAAGEQVVHAVEPLGRRLSSDDRSEELRQRIAAAGFAGRLSAEAFVAFRLILTILAFAGSVLVLGVFGVSTWMLVFAMVLPVATYFAPGFIIDRVAASRREQIAADLPDALDLLAVTVEAGLGLYGAIARLCESTTGPLADEFGLVLTELRVGQSSERALRNMAKRVNCPEVTSFVRSLIQGEKLGLSLASTLRSLATDTRRKRRAVAEERAAKAPVKMLFPAALFIFPALFVVILGPALLILRHFL